jgi:hypothetical protein
MACVGKMSNAYTVLVGKPEGKRLFRRCGHRWMIDLVLGKEGDKVWTGCTWLRIGCSGGLLRTW